ncbi:MAG: response regulator, partial [Rhodobacteraceae bacterium]|nr:response regulator [Paracoccaceae bacterium]
QDLAGPVLERTVALHVAPPEAGLRVLCDPSQLANALLNLVLNSRNALLGQRGTGNIMVQAGRAAESDPQGHPLVEILVTDDGPGMSPEVRQRATDPFFTTRGESGRTGLGLSMVYGFAEQSGGELITDTASGSGTSGRILLPEGELPDEQEVAAEPGLSPGSGETILVVEDETDLLAMTSEIIRTLGNEVITAPSGRAALERIERGAESFDLLLTDIVMPGGVGGFVLARRRNDLRPGIPVIYMSGYASITRESMDGVPAPTLRKPCSPAAPSAASSRRGDGRGYAVPAGRGSFRHAPGSHRPVCCRREPTWLYAQPPPELSGKRYGL